MKSFSKGRLTASVGLVALAGLLGACASAEQAEPEALEQEAVETETAESTEPESTEPEIQSLSIGIKPIPGYAPIQVAVSEGLFQAEGLDVSLEVMGPGTTVPAVVGGTVQFSGNTWLAVVQAEAQGIDLVNVAELERGVPGYAEFVVASGSSVQSLADLDGAVIGVPESPGNCDLAALAVEQEENLGASFEFIALPVPDMPGAVARGDVDAACVPEPILGGMKASGDFRPVFDVFAGNYDDFPVSGVFTTAEFAAENPNTVAAVQRALAAAKDLAQADEQVIRDAILEYTPAPPAAVAGMTLPSYPDDDFTTISAAIALLEATGQIDPGLVIEGVND